MLLALTKQNSIIRLESRHLKIISSSEDTTEIIPVKLLDRVILSDCVRISGAVIQQLLEAHIPIFILGKYEKYLGQFHYTPAGDCQRRRLQALFLPDENLIPAKQLLSAKLYNQKRLLQRLAANRKQRCDACHDIDKMQKKIMNQQSLDKLKGIEGIAAHYYFDALAQYLPDWCKFRGR